MAFRQYMTVKETLLRESVKLGYIAKDDATKMFKLEKRAVEATYDFLVENEDISTVKPLQSISEMLEQ